ncbi:MAG: hypothetical protein AAFY16_12830 [Cyanobacteria bacterium J06642_3]
MVLRSNGFLVMLFLTAACGSLMNPPPYIAIAIFFFLMGFVLLPAIDKLIQQRFQRQIKGGVKSMIILISLLIICLIVPQVDTNTSRLFKNPIANLKVNPQS